MVQMDYEPEGLVENAGDALGLAERRVKGDLERFKELIESRARRPAPGAVRSTRPRRGNTHTKNGSRGRRFGAALCGS